MVKKDSELNTARVIIPEDMRKPPEAHEIKTAWILAQHFSTTVEFLRPADTYKNKTADFRMNDKLFEIKSPQGKARDVIRKQLRRAIKQSENIVIDASRFPYSDAVIQNRIRYELRKWKQIKSLLLITKDGKVIEMVD
jgi:hypothetical protein